MGSEPANGSVGIKNPASDFSGRGAIRDDGLVLPYFVTGVNSAYLPSGDLFFPVLSHHLDGLVFHFLAAHHAEAKIFIPGMLIEKGDNRFF